MNDIQLTHLLQKLYDIDRGLGGQAKKLKGKNATEFEAIKDVLIEKLFALGKRQNEKEEKLRKFGNDRDQIALGVKIRDDIHELERLIKGMDDALRRQAKNPKKYPKVELQVKEKQFQNFCDQLENCKARESGAAVNDDAVQIKVQTFTEQKNQLLGVGAHQNRGPARYEMTKDEEEALARWKNQDQEMDHKLDQIIDVNDQLKYKAQMIGDKIDHAQKQVGVLTKEVDKTNETLMTQNQKLKVLIAKVSENYLKTNYSLVQITQQVLP